jgi:hypothetical protein
MTVAEVLGIVATSIGIIAVLGKWLILNPLRAFIKEQTYPIQPTANGGRSLPDIAYSVNRIEKQLDEHINLHIKGDI